MYESIVDIPSAIYSCLYGFTFSIYSTRIRNSYLLSVLYEYVQLYGT